MSEQPDKRPRMEIELAKVAARVSMIEEELSYPLTELGFRKAAKLITELENLGGSDDYGTLLRVAEYELQISRGKCDVALKNLKNFMERLSETSCRDAMANNKNLCANGRKIAASIVIWTCYELYHRTGATSREAVSWIAKRVEEMGQMANILAITGGRSRGIAIEFSIKKMYAMLECLRELKELDLHRVLSEGICLVSIAKVHHVTKMYTEACRAAREGIRLIEQTLSGRALRFCVYAKLLNCAGMALGCMGDPLTAEVYFIQAKGATSLAYDFPDEDHRKEEYSIAEIGADLTADTLMLDEE